MGRRYHLRGDRAFFVDDCVVQGRAAAMLRLKIRRGVHA
jgi:hypothetical protein